MKSVPFQLSLTLFLENNFENNHIGTLVAALYYITFQIVCLFLLISNYSLRHHVKVIEIYVEPKYFSPVFMKVSLSPYCCITAII